MDIDDLKARLRRPGIRLEVGGFRPSDDPAQSWFGRVNLGASGEAWPEYDGAPMHALCQINLTTLPFRPNSLEDIAFITIFIGPKRLPIDTPNGKGWCLRAYKSGDELVPLAQRDTGSDIKPFPMAPRVIEADFPCWEDVPFDLPSDISDSYYDLFENVGGFKLGGWPTLVQAEIFWAPWNRHPASPEYVFQIDSDAKAHWSWGDSGVGYFGRGTAIGKRNEWTLTWQCY